MVSCLSACASRARACSSYGFPASAAAPAGAASIAAAPVRLRRGGIALRRRIRRRSLWRLAGCRRLPPQPRQRPARPRCCQAARHRPPCGCIAARGARRCGGVGGSCRVRSRSTRGARGPRRLQGQHPQARPPLLGQQLSSQVKQEQRRCVQLKDRYSEYYGKCCLTRSVTTPAQSQRVWSRTPLCMRPSKSDLLAVAAPHVHQ